MHILLLQCQRMTGAVAGGAGKAFKSFTYFISSVLDTLGKLDISYISWTVL